MTRPSLSVKLQTRPKCTFISAPLTPSGTGGFELTFLGTSSQGGARRYPSCMAMRLRGYASSEVWLFDAGEGAMAQLQRSNMRVGLVRNIFITHLHGDHLYGLPGLVMSILGRRDAELKNAEDLTLNVYGPQGIRSFLRMALGVAGFRIKGKGVLQINELVWPELFGGGGQQYRHRLSSAYWKCSVRRLGFENGGRDIEARIGDNGEYTYDLSGTEEEQEDGGDSRWRSARRPASVVAAPVAHTIPTFAFAVTENVVTRRFNKSKLMELGIPTDGREEVRQLFHEWLGDGTGIWKGQEIRADDVMHAGRQPRRICVVGDTYDAGGAGHIAHGVDVLVHEATTVAAQTDVAIARGHSSTVGATAFAKRIAAKRLILNHTSVAYSERKIRAMEMEARGMFGTDRVFVARDLSVFSVPTCEEDGNDFVFRRFAGFADSLEFRESGQSPFSGDFDVADSARKDEEGEYGGKAKHALKEERGSSPVAAMRGTEGSREKEEEDDDMRLGTAADAWLHSTGTR